MYISSLENLRVSKGDWTSSTIPTFVEDIPVVQVYGTSFIQTYMYIYFKICKVYVVRYILV